MESGRKEGGGRRKNHYPSSGLSFLAMETSCGRGRDRPKNRSKKGGKEKFSSPWCEWLEGITAVAGLEEGGKQKGKEKTASKKKNIPDAGHMKKHEQRKRGWSGCLPRKTSTNVENLVSVQSPKNKRFPIQ